MEITLQEGELPESVLVIVRETTAAYSDIAEAQKAAEVQIRALPEFGTFVDVLVGRAIARLVAIRRHDNNKIIKRSAFSRPPVIAKPAAARITYHESPAVKRIFNSMYEMGIGKNVLGNLLGKELLAVAEQEQRTGDGHITNARLLRRLAPLVPANERVRDAVSNKTLREILDSVKAAPVVEAAAI